MFRREQTGGHVGYALQGAFIGCGWKQGVILERGGDVLREGLVGEGSVWVGVGSEDGLWQVWFLGWGWCDLTGRIEAGKGWCRLRFVVWGM